MAPRPVDRRAFRDQLQSVRAREASAPLFGAEQRGLLRPSRSHPMRLRLDLVAGAL